MFNYKFGMCLVAAAFIVWGLHTIMHPATMAIPHFAERYASPSMQIIPGDSARVYGILSLLMGAGLLVLIFYPDRKK